ncbi:MAG: hypothetical protein ABIS06_20295 [Vicinamibacterales bacterium]
MHAAYGLCSLALAFLCGIVVAANRQRQAPPTFRSRVTVVRTEPAFCSATDTSRDGT